PRHRFAVRATLHRGRRDRGMSGLKAHARSHAHLDAVRRDRRCTVVGVGRRYAALSLGVALATALLLLAAARTPAQQPRQKAGPAAPAVAKEAPHTQLEEIKREQQPGAKESVQADVSARNVPVTSSFHGTEIVIFGAVDNSQQPSAESGYYDVLIVVEGVPGRIVVRRKNNV